MHVIYLIRHGETDHNRDGRVQGHTDSKLSDLGVEQAERTRERLPRAEIKAAYSSSLSRAMDTAKICMDGTIPVQACAGLREMNLGIWEGQKAADLRKQYPEQVRLWFHEPSKVRIDGAETVADFRDRVAKAMSEIRATAPDGTLAVFAHGGVICVYLNHLLGMALDDIWRFKIRNASLTRLVFPQDKPRIDLLGDIHHLRGAMRDAPARPFRLFP